MKNISYVEVSGKNLDQYLDQLANLRITVFKEFPYLYDGNLDYEREYLKTYLHSQNSYIILALNNEKVIGASTCIAMKDADQDFKKAFAKKEFDHSKMVYFGESILLKEYRGNKIGHEFFKRREDFSKNLIPNLEYTTFCAVDRPSDHPLRPSNYQPLNSFWNRMGYQMLGNIKAYYTWKDIDQNLDTQKAMSVWLKKWCFN